MSKMKQLRILKVMTTLFVLFPYLPVETFADQPLTMGAGSQPVINIACFPPIDLTPCPRDDALDWAYKKVAPYVAECGKVLTDQDSLMKYAALAAVAASGPGGLYVAYGIAAKSMVLKDALKCFLKGYVESTDATPEQKQFMKDAVNVGFEAYSIKELSENFYKWEYMKIEDFKLFASSVQRIQGLKKFDDAYRTFMEVVYGPSTKAANFLSDYNQSVLSCDFATANLALDQMHFWTDIYCKSAGGHYRAAEKALRCEEEQIIDKQQMYRFYSEQHRREVDNLRKMLKDILDQMKILNEADKRIDLEERRKVFDGLKKPYDEEVQVIKQALRNRNFQDACSRLDVLLKRGDNLWQSLTPGCAKIINMGSEGLELELNQQARRMEQEVEQWLNQAKRNIDRCERLDEVQSLLDKALKNWPLIWSHTGDGCQPTPKAGTFTDTHKQLSNSFGGIRGWADKYTRAIESGKQLAIDLCTYEFALSNALAEDLLWDSGVKGCVPTDRIEKDVKTIKDLQHGSSEKAESVLKSLLDQIEEVKKRLPAEAKPLSCEFNEDGLEGVRLSAISQLCTDLSPLPDGAKARAEKINTEIQSAKQFIQEAVTKQKKAASDLIEKALSEAQENLDSCNPVEAQNRLIKLESEVQANCLTAEQAGQRDSLASRATEFDKELQKAMHSMEVLCKEAEKTLQSCDWGAFDNQVAEASQALASEVCYEKYPAFSKLSGRLTGLKSQAIERRARQEEYSNKGFKLKEKIDKSLLEKWERDGFWTSDHKDNFMRNLEPLQALQGEVVKAGMRECLSDFMNEVEDIIARAGRLPSQSEQTGGGFSSAGGGQTQQGDPAAPDKQTDGGFSAAGPGVTKKNDPGNPAGGVFAAGVPGITTPLASPDSGGFSSAGSGATSHSDPTAGNEGTSGNRDARPPTASVGTPPSGSTPIIVRPQPFRGDGQPAAVHIFGATSRMGWAGGLAEYSVGPADQSIVEHLMTAGEHVMWANKMSFPPTPAWPGWSEKRSWLQSQANELARNRTNDYRRQIAGSMSGNYGSMCSELSVQTFGTTQKAANCDAYYCRLGFLMARGQQALLIADEANNNRDKQTTDKARADGLSHLSQAVQVLSDYERVLAVSGRCADLRDVKQMLMNIIQGGNIPDQTRAAGTAWQTAAERIAALGQEGPPQPGKYEECLKKYCPECLQTIDLLGVAKDQKCNDCKRKNEKLINECVAGTPSPVERPAPPQPSTGGGKPTKTPAQALGTDPGELEGYWVNGGRIYRFVKQGDEYIGSIEHSEEPAAEFGIREGVEVYRLKRLGPNLYKGTYHKRRAPTRSSSPPYAMSVDRQEPVWVSVLGIVAFGWGPGASTAYLSPVFNVRPPRTIAETWLGAPDYYESLGLIRVQNPGTWTIPNGRRVRLLGGARDPSNAYWSYLLFPSVPGLSGKGKPFWFIASGKNPDGKPVFIVFPDYDRAVAGGMNPEGDPHVPWGPTTRDDYRIDNLSREYLTRGGFSVIFGPANVGNVMIELGKYPQDVTGVRR